MAVVVRGGVCFDSAEDSVGEVFRGCGANFVGPHLQGVTDLFDGMKGLLTASARRDVGLDFFPIGRVDLAVVPG